MWVCLLVLTDRSYKGFKLQTVVSRKSDEYDDDDDDDDEWICRARQSSDALQTSQTGGPSNVERTSEERELQFAERLVNLSR